MAVKSNEQQRYEEFWQQNTYVSGSYDQRRDFELLAQELSKREQHGTRANRLFYLALPSSIFEVVTTFVRETCMGEK